LEASWLVWLHRRVLPTQAALCEAGGEYPFGKKSHWVCEVGTDLQIGKCQQAAHSGARLLVCSGRRSGLITSSSGFPRARGKRIVCRAKTKQSRVRRWECGMPRPSMGPQATSWRTPKRLAVSCPAGVSGAARRSHVGARSVQLEQGRASPSSRGIAEDPACLGCAGQPQQEADPNQQKPATW